MQYDPGLYFGRYRLARALVSWYVPAMIRVCTALLMGLVMAMTGCFEPMDPISLVNKFRVMAVQADPPEIRPGEGTTLRVLFSDPDDRPVQVGWFVCLGELGASMDLAAAGQDGAGAAGACEPIGGDFGIAEGNVAEYRVPEVPLDALSDLPPDELFEFATVVVTLCAGGEFPTDMESGGGGFTGDEDICVGGDGLIALKTFRISEQDDANRNTNPIIDDVWMDDKLLAPLDMEGGGNPAADTDTQVIDTEDTDTGDIERDAGTGDAGTGDAGTDHWTTPVLDFFTGRFVCSNTESCLKGVPLHATLTDNSFETYEQEILGNMETIDEDPYISWFVTEGNLGPDRARADSEKKFGVTWHPPLEGGVVAFYVVAHDLRGGTSWKKYTLEAITAE